VAVKPNVICADHYGIFAAGPVTVVGQSSNLFLADSTPFGSTPVYAG
jgi:hypothetical protein